AGVTDEVEALAVRAPLRVDLLGPGEWPQRGDLTGHPAGHVDQRELIIAIRQTVEGCTETVRGERNGLAVGRPGGLEVGVQIVREPRELARIDVIDEEIGHAPDLRAERDLLAVGRPRGIKD